MARTLYSFFFFFFFFFFFVLSPALLSYVVCFEVEPLLLIWAPPIFFCVFESMTFDII
ncbi:hypothetical protein IC582_007628 [Cucumis melo]